jgi:hypothetical protein
MCMSSRCGASCVRTRSTFPGAILMREPRSRVRHGTLHGAARECDRHLCRRKALDPSAGACAGISEARHGRLTPSRLASLARAPQQPAGGDFAPCRTPFAGRGDEFAKRVRDGALPVKLVSRKSLDSIAPDHRPPLSSRVSPGAVRSGMLARQNAAKRVATRTANAAMHHTSKVAWEIMGKIRHDGRIWAKPSRNAELIERFRDDLFSLDHYPSKFPGLGATVAPSSSLVRRRGAFEGRKGSASGRAPLQSRASASRNRAPRRAAPPEAERYRKGALHRVSAVRAKYANADDVRRAWRFAAEHRRMWARSGAPSEWRWRAECR